MSVVSELTLTENQSEMTVGLESKDYHSGDGGQGSTLDAASLCGLGPAFTDSPVGGDKEVAHSNVVGQELFSSTHDEAVTDETSCASSQIVDDKGLTEEFNDDDKSGNKVDSSDAVVVVADSDSEKNNCDLNFEVPKRTLELETDTISRSLPVRNQRPVPQKPGVILLGRGNSFSLGRSEVIVLHHRPKSTKVRKPKQRGIVSNKQEKLLTIDERQVSVENGNVRLNVTGESGGVESDDHPTIPSPSPPPVSNGLYHPDSQQTGLTADSNDDDDGNFSSGVIDLVPSYEDDLQELWHKAESMMALRKDKVRKILEEFGIGEPGGGGGEDETNWEDQDVEDRKKEEEEVWHIVQDNFTV